MFTHTTTRREQQIHDISNFAKLLKDNGFTVLISTNHPFEWLYFIKEHKIGYVQPDDFCNYNFTSIHKPCIDYGRGFRTATQTALTLNNAIDALNKKGWWYSAEFYKDIHEFTKYLDRNKQSYYEFQ